MKKTACKALFTWKASLACIQSREIPHIRRPQGFVNAESCKSGTECQHWGFAHGVAEDLPGRYCCWVYSHFGIVDHDKRKDVLCGHILP